MISKSVLTIRFGLAKNKLRQAEANIFYPVCTIIDMDRHRQTEEAEFQFQQKKC